MVSEVCSTCNRAHSCTVCTAIDLFIAGPILIFLMQSRQRGGPPPKGPPANMPGVNSVEFPVPGNKCGLIIGKGESHNGEVMNTKKTFISESVKYLFNFLY